MLVLSRKVNEVICVGDDIEIVVLEMRRGIVRLGIEAPQDVPVHRKEVYLKIQQQNAEDEDEKTPKCQY